MTATSDEKNIMEAKKYLRKASKQGSLSYTGKAHIAYKVDYKLIELDLDLSYDEVMWLLSNHLKLK